MNFARPIASLPPGLLTCPFLSICIDSTPSVARSAVWREPKHCLARHLLRVARRSCSITLLRYFTRRSLQSGGGTFSLTEAANASGYEACLSAPVVDGGGQRSALIIILKNLSAAETSLLALSISPMVAPPLPTARYKYSHALPTLTYVSSTRKEAPLTLRCGLTLLSTSGA